MIYDRAGAHLDLCNSSVVKRSLVTLNTAIRDRAREARVTKSTDYWRGHVDLVYLGKECPSIRVSITTGESYLHGRKLALHEIRALTVKNRALG